MAPDPHGFFLGPSNIEHELSPPTPESITDNELESPSSTDSPPFPRPAEHGTRGSVSKPSSFVAFGSLRLFQKSPNDESWLMSAGDHKVDFPPEVLRDPTRRGWLRLDQISHAARPDLGTCRVYLLPEDVNRAARGSPKPFRKVVKWLMSVVDISSSTWSGHWGEKTPFRKYGAPATDQEESLFWIFNTLDSPVAGPISGSPHATTAMETILTDSIPGVKTDLYPYQKRSIASMLRREECPAKSQDTRKPEYTDLDGHPFYFDTFEGVVLRHGHLYEDPRGGILAETMGYGKTLACIALIATTRGHYPGLPEARIEQPNQPVYDKTPSLLTMAARAMRQKGIPWKAEFAALRSQGYHFDRCVDELQKYQAEFGEPIFTPTTPGRKVSKRQAERTLRLSNATLVIVPPNILAQWVSEIAKHTLPGALDVLVIDMSVKEMPHWEKLKEYDVVLISKNRLDAEFRDDDLHQGKRNAGSDKYSSQLTELRWLRVICDEGHAFAGSTSKTRTMAMLDKLSVERRWIVSGTPSSSLIGVDVNLAADEVPEQKRKDYMEVALQRKRVPDWKQEEKDIERLRQICAGYLKVKPWANQKGHDQASWKKYFSPFDANGNRRCAPGLRSLLQSLIGKMSLVAAYWFVSSLLATRHQLMGRQLQRVAPYTLGNTCQPPSQPRDSLNLHLIRVVTDLQFLVRHRITDINCEVTLPPLHNTTVLLEPTHHDKLSQNLFRMVLASNAVTSERTDEDYIHHPKNRKVLDTLITNLRQATFYWVGFTVAELQTTIDICKKYLEKQADSPNVTEPDKRLLQDAVYHAERALDDPIWRATSKLHQMGTFVEKFPDRAAAAWSLNGEQANPLPVGTHQILDLRRFLGKHLFEEDPTAGLIGAGMRSMIEARKRAEADGEKSSKGSKFKGHAHSATVPLNSEAPQALIGLPEEPQIRQTPTKALSATSGSITKLPSPRKRQLSTITPPSTPMSSASMEMLTAPRVTGFTSAKLTYLCNSILAQPPDTKSIIFYEANNTAFWLAEALEVLGISHLIYANTLSPAKRAKHLSMFNNDEADPHDATTSGTSDNKCVWRVLLMDLRQASTGLHCAAASRVYIITPIWRREVEAQAIKRAHRIGQKKEVFVETLVLKGTIEERLWRRRRARSDDEDAGIGLSAGSTGNPDKAEAIPHGKITSSGTNIMTSGGWLEDQGVVDVIKNEGFLEIDEDQKGDGTEKAARLDGDGVQLFKRELEMRRAFMAATAIDEDVRKKRRVDFEAVGMGIMSKDQDKGKDKGTVRVGFADAESRVSFGAGVDALDRPRSSIFGGVGSQQHQHQHQDHQVVEDGQLKLTLKFRVPAQTAGDDGNDGEREHG